MLHKGGPASHQGVLVVQAQAEQHTQQAEMHVHLLQEANASLASERSTLLQRAVTAERALGTEREALVHRALTAEQATCALMEQHARDTAASSGSQSEPISYFPPHDITAQQGSEMCTGVLAWVRCREPPGPTNMWRTVSLDCACTVSRPESECVTVMCRHRL